MPDNYDHRQRYRPMGPFRHTLTRIGLINRINRVRTGLTRPIYKKNLTDSAQFLNSTSVQRSPLKRSDVMHLKMMQKGLVMETTQVQNNNKNLLIPGRLLKIANQVTNLTLN